ncbi:MAG: hypothetical protein Q8P05_05325 [Candidatus Diapherotrites archaeon]|nr:hypothetical protein [Candidatus Diapherotrites archaeon]MDZ4256864.1 hypothetical protein [archaeon]
MPGSFGDWLVGGKQTVSCTPEEAARRLEAILGVDRTRTAEIVAMRAAEVKHTLSRMIPTMDEKGAQWLERLTPPRSEEALLAYAVEAHPYFETQVGPAMRPGANENSSSHWWGELEEALLDMRRVAVQNLSKHPAQKGLGLLSRWRESVERDEEASRRVYGLERELRNTLRGQNEVEDEEAALSGGKGYDTYFRLRESRDSLLRRKQGLESQWMHVWEKVAPVLEKLYADTPSFAAMENAQLRLLQLYLAHPQNARARDVHGAGLVMVLRLAVDALEEKENSSDEEAAREIILGALEEKVFTDYFWLANELEVALQGNAKELHSHPIHRRKQKLMVRMAQLERDKDRIKGELEEAREALDKSGVVRRRAWQEATSFITMEWGWEIVFEESPFMSP